MKNLLIMKIQTYNPQTQFRLKSRNHRADIAIKRSRGGHIFDPWIPGAGPDSVNSRTSAALLLQGSQSPRAGYFGLSPQRASFGEFCRILHACKKQKSAKAESYAMGLEDCGEYLTPAQLKLRYRCKSNSNFWELVKSLQIPRLVLNQRKILFPREALLAWEAKRTIGSSRGGGSLS